MRCRVAMTELTARGADGVGGHLVVAEPGDQRALSAVGGEEAAYELGQQPGGVLKGLRCAAHQGLEAESHILANGFT